MAPVERRKRHLVGVSYEGYQEARAVIEDLVATNTASEALEHAQYYLQTHCQQCGQPLLGAQRGQPDRLCRRCRDPLPAAAHGPTITHAQQRCLDSGVLDRWPEGVRVQIARFWQAPAVQTLITEAHAAGYELPVLRFVAPGVLGESRQQLLHTPEFMTVVLAAARAGVGVRQLAAVLFGGVPGAASDMIARAIDGQDPTARQNKRR